MTEDIKAKWTSALAMNKEAKNHWLKRLKAAQKTTGQLHDQKGFSAIGVLCKAYWERTGNGCWLVNGGFSDAQGNTSRTGAPKHVLHWADLEDRGPGIQWMPAMEKGTIVAVNDGLGSFVPHTFAQIQRIIRDHL